MAFLREQRSARIAQWGSEHLSVAHLFAPDTTLPFQYAELLRRKTSLEGEKELGFAVLEDAVNCFRKYHAAHDEKANGSFERLKSGSWIREMIGFSLSVVSATRWGSIPVIYVGHRKNGKKIKAQRIRKKGGRTIE